MGYNEFGTLDDDGPTSKPGDGGIYSSVDDLLRWDQALYTSKLVPPTALRAAFSPGRVAEGTSTSGFGWNITREGDEISVWYTGNQAGFRAFIERRLGQRLAVIMLTNIGNTKRVDINNAIVDILAGKPYTMRDSRSPS